MFDLAELEATGRWLATLLPATPQIAWPLLAERLGATVSVKHENHLPTGAFKVRGGLTYLEDLRGREPGLPGVITATRGNHGQSVAFAARRLGLRAVIVVPHGNSREKNQAIRAMGAELVESGHDFQAAREYAMATAAREGLHPIPPWHPLLVRGVATYGLEWLRAVPELDLCPFLCPGCTGADRDVRHLRRRHRHPVARSGGARGHPAGCRSNHPGGGGRDPGGDALVLQRHSPGGGGSGGGPARCPGPRAGPGGGANGWSGAERREHRPGAVRRRARVGLTGPRTPCAPLCGARGGWE